MDDPFTLLDDEPAPVAVANAKKKRKVEEVAPEEEKERFLGHAENPIELLDDWEYCSVCGKAILELGRKTLHETFCRLQKRQSDLAARKQHLKQLQGYVPEIVQKREEKHKEKQREKKRRRDQHRPAPAAHRRSQRQVPGRLEFRSGGNYQKQPKDQNKTTKNLSHETGTTPKHMKKGFDLLRQMGWNGREGIGKTPGRTQPLNVQRNAGQRGLGYAGRLKHSSSSSRKKKQ
jgi:hypothetical protein